MGNRTTQIKNKLIYNPHYVRKGLWGINVFSLSLSQIPLTLNPSNSSHPQILWDKYIILIFHPSKQKVKKKLKGEKEKSCASLLLIYYFVVPIFLCLETFSLRLTWNWGGHGIILEVHLSSSFQKDAFLWLFLLFCREFGLRETIGFLERWKEQWWNTTFWY